jgi:crossover junction endodeoxyribonuclease RuvC
MEASRPFRVLGVDPGTLRMGLALLEARGPGVVKLIASGVASAPASLEPAARLGRLLAELTRFVDRHAPDFVALESPFFGKNALSMMRLGEARGGAMALAGARGLPIADYPPARVKKAVTGNGNASKGQVARTLALLLPELGPADAIEHLDETDAIAVAWCHLVARGMEQRRAAVTAAAAGPRPARAGRKGAPRVAATETAEGGAKVLTPQQVAAAVSRWQQRR